MKSHRLSPFFSFGFAVMLLLSVAVHPVLAMESAKKEMQSFSIDDVDAVMINEQVLDVSGAELSGSSAEVFEESHQGKVHIKACDPFATRQSFEEGDFSGSSGETGEPLDKELEDKVRVLISEGYNPTGKSEHRYTSTIDSEKFQNLDRMQQAGLKSQGLQADTGTTTISTTQDVTYHFFTNPVTNVTRAITVVQLLDNDGSPVGKRNLSVSEDLIEPTNDTEGDFSASVVTETTGLLTGVAVIAPSLGPIGWAFLIFVAIVVIVIVVESIIIATSDDDTPTPTPTLTPVPSSNIALFGDTSQITKWPSGTDYSRLGGSSAIRRDGSADAFTQGQPYFTGNDWVMVTNGAAIETDGTLVAWQYGGLTPIRWNPCGVKKYVAISQERDWLLDIHENINGQTYLEPIANPGSPPEVFKQTPTDSGWKMVAAGNRHALALRSDGTLVAWGNNSDGQLDLPTGIKYHEIEAGDDFSIALDASGTIYARGNDTYGQISDIPTGTGYMAIAAGPATGAALTKNGTIVLWGKQMSGTLPPSGTGFTDISLSDGYGFALRENVKEAVVTEPLSPERSLKALDGTMVEIPFGSSFDHTHNDVTRVFAPDGTQLIWTNDENATQVHFPAGAVVPISVLHYVPSGSQVDGTVDYTATVSSTGGLAGGAVGDVMTVTEDAWYDEQDPSKPQSLPRAMCFADKGCSVGVSTKQQLFLSDPPMPIRNGDIPVFSVHQLANKSWVGTIGTLTADGSAASGESGSLVMDKNRVDPGQPINFSIVSANWGNTPGQNLFVTAKAELTGGDSALHYTIMGTSSASVPSVSVIPRIYKQTPTGDVLVFTGPAQTCSSGKTCTVRGDFVPVWDVSNITSMFFANTTVLFTLPSTGVGAGGLTSVGIQPPETESAPTVPEVVVTGELSPQEPGTIVTASNANNVIPWGGTIVHAINNGMPVTTISDASGKPQSWADDRKATDLGTPYGSAYPGTWIHEIPSGSNVDLGDKRSIVKYNGTLSYTEDYSLNPMNPRDIAAGSLRTSVTDVSSFNGYVEYAGGRPYTLSHLSGNWKVPSNPTSSSSKPQTIFLFNGVQGINAATGNNTIIQPVLEWYAGDTGKYWTISPWVCGEPCVHTVRLSASTGDEINGNMHYLPPDSTEPKDFWQVSITNKKTGSTKVNTTTQITNKNLLVIAGALEGYYLTEPSALPGDTKFYSNTYLDANYNPISISLSKIYPVDEPAWIKNHRGIDIDSSSGDVTLKTYST